MSWFTMSMILLNRFSFGVFRFLCFLLTYYKYFYIYVQARKGVIFGLKYVLGIIYHL